MRRPSFNLLDELKKALLPSSTLSSLSDRLADIDEAIDALGDKASGCSRDGLSAVAHLGGKAGMKKFVRSNGEYNPEDEHGSSLREYYEKFSGKIYHCLHPYFAKQDSITSSFAFSSAAHLPRPSATPPQKPPPP